MQKDNLERFISDNRDAFDKAAPRMKVWEGIEQKIEQKPAKRIAIWKFARMAAAVALLLGVGAAMGVYFSNGQQQVANTFSNISPEHAEMEEYFKAEIQSRTKKLASFNKDKTVNEDLVQLEDLLKDLEKELQQSPPANNERIIDAMIQNYRTRIELLEHVLNRIDHKEEKKEEKETSI